MVLGLLLFAFLELSARVLLATLADRETYLAYASITDLHRGPMAPPALRYAPHRYVGYVPRPGFGDGRDTHNSHGYRDEEIVLPKPAGEFRIVCVGGSTTYSSSTEDPALAFPNRLESELRARGHTHVNVINAAADGYSSYEFLPLLALRLRYLQPDFVIFHTGYNDTFMRLVWPPAAFRPDNSGVRLPAVGNTPVPGPWEHSTLLRMVGVALGLLPAGTELRAVFDPLAETALADDLERQLSGGSYPEGIFVTAPAERIFAANTDDHFLRNMDALLVLLKLDGVGALVTSEPLTTTVLEPAADGSLPPAKGLPLPSFRPFRRALEATNVRLGELAARLDVSWFDLADAFPDDPALFTDGLHTTVLGDEVKGHLLAEFLLARGLVPAAPTK